MNLGLSEQVRTTAEAIYIRQARQKGRGGFSIRVLDLQHELRKAGFPPNHVRQICEALRSKEFLRRNKVRIFRTDGPPSLTSTTVVFHYAFADSLREDLNQAVSMGTAKTISSSEPIAMPVTDQSSTCAAGAETSAERARRITNSLRGILREELAEYGGGEAFMKWIRADEISST